MKNMRLAVVLGSMLWISSVSAEIVSYNLNVMSNSWDISSGTLGTPFGVAEQPTFTGTFKADASSGKIVDFNMVTGSQTWTIASLNSTTSV